MTQAIECGSAGVFSGFDGQFDNRFDNQAEETERDGLLRLTGLVEHLFRVPVAYMALLNAELGVSSRIGSGRLYWENLRGFPPEGGSAGALVWAGASGYGDIQFAASAPMLTSDGLQLGALVIGDVVPRPDFQDRDLEALAELAGALAGKMELRLMAHLARERESAIQAAEDRFWTMADAAPVMIIYA